MSNLIDQACKSRVYLYILGLHGYIRHIHAGSINLEIENKLDLKNHRVRLFNVIFFRLEILRKIVHTSRTHVY